MTVTVPDVEQRMTALQDANGTRGARRALRLRVRSMGRPGAALLAAMVEEPPYALHTMLAWHLLQYAVRVGEDKAAKMLRAARVSPWTKVGRLTVRQRTALAAELRRHAAAPPVPKRTATPAPNIALSQFCECGERLARPTRSGLCGFCREERAA